MRKDESEGDFKWNDEIKDHQDRKIDQNTQKQTQDQSQKKQTQDQSQLPKIILDESPISINTENMLNTENMQKLEIKTNDDGQKNQIEKEETISKSDIREVINILQKIATGIVEIEGMLPYIYDDKGRETTRRGRAHVYKYLNYYDVTTTIKRSSSEDPQDFDSPVYNVERVFEILERYSDIIHVINGGTSPLFVIISHEGKTNFSKESVIFPGEVKDFYNVYELRLRSPEVGLPYRVTEYLIMSVSQTSLIPIEIISLHNEFLPVAGENWLDTDIIPIITPTTFRIEVAVSKTGIFRAAITNGGNTQVVDFNAASGPELIEDGLYVFELLVNKGDSVNFQFSNDDGKIKILRVQEIDAAIA